MELQQLTRDVVPHAPATCGPDDEEVADRPQLARQALDERKARRRALVRDQVAAAVGIVEVPRKTPRLVQAVGARHRSPELRHVVRVQLPEPFDQTTVVVGQDAQEFRRAHRAILPVDVLESEECAVPLVIAD